MDFGWAQIVIGIMVALLVGFSKTGIPAAGIFSVTLMALAFPVKDSVGILLPMLITGDIVAVSFYRKQVVWKHLISLIPWVLIGIIGGYFVLRAIDSAHLKILIGVLVISLVALHLIRAKWGDSFLSRFMTSMWFSAFIGILAGFATTVGNAAGGVMAIYLLSKNLPKHQFVGTGAWFFLSVNLLKVPFNLQLGLITLHSLVFNLWLVPVILVGTWIGIKLLPKIPQKYFQTVILLLSVIGAIELML